MYKIIKDVLNTGKFNLSEILKKVDTFWVQGELSDAQKNELYNLAQEKAKPEHSADLLKKIATLEHRILSIEKKLLKDGETLPDVEITDTEYSEFVVGKWYYKDNAITFEGNRYRCIAPEGVACVWSPKDYPAYWQAE